MFPCFDGPHLFFAWSVREARHQFCVCFKSSLTISFNCLGSAFLQHESALGSWRFQGLIKVQRWYGPELGVNVGVPGHGGP